MIKRLLYFILLPILMFSCQKEDPSAIQKVKPSKIKRAVLIYAVNKSSLSYDFTQDSREILTAASQIDMNEYQILLYRTDSNESCGLYSVGITNSGEPSFTLIKQYDRDKTSTAPERIKEVVDYSLTLYPNAEYDLIFWGHGMSWKPYFTDHQIDIPADHAYGGEFTGGVTSSGSAETDWTEIDELADCVPDGVFDTIWFDCCYMTGIEVIYEFRDKCNTYVGYPTEVWSEGLSYDLILPYLLSESHNITGAAVAFFNYYNKGGEPVTVAVVDMSKLEPMADATSAIVKSGEVRPYVGNLINYSRTSSAPFYDFRQYWTETANLNDASHLVAPFEKAFDDLVIYHAESDRNFNLHPWDTSNISGISTHNYRGSASADEEYYRTLDWFKRVF